jgi:hypothetical protein
MLEGSIHQLPNMNISHGPQTDSGDSVEQILRPPPTLATEYIDQSDGALIWLALQKYLRKSIQPHKEQVFLDVESAVILSAPLLIIMDCELTDRKVFLLRRLHHQS